MVLDTSAVVAIFLNEPERERFLHLALEAPTLTMSAASVLECAIMLEAKRGEAAGREFDLFLVKLKVDIAAVTSEHMEIARLAWRQFGKGRHPAGLNFGDCFCYALAKSIGQPLLAKGDDFRLTDLDVA